MGIKVKIEEEINPKFLDQTKFHAFFKKHIEMVKNRNFKENK